METIKIASNVLEILDDEMRHFGVRPHVYADEGFITGDTEALTKFISETKGKTDEEIVENVNCDIAFLGEIDGASFMYPDNIDFYISSLTGIQMAVETLGKIDFQYSPEIVKLEISEADFRREIQSYFRNYWFESLIDLLRDHQPKPYSEKAKRVLEIIWSEYGDLDGSLIGKLVSAIDE